MCIDPHNTQTMSRCALCLLVFFSLFSPSTGHVSFYTFEGVGRDRGRPEKSYPSTFLAISIENQEKSTAANHMPQKSDNVDTCFVCLSKIGSKHIKSRQGYPLWRQLSLHFVFFVYLQSRPRKTGLGQLGPS